MASRTSPTATSPVQSFSYYDPSSPVRMLRATDGLIGTVFRSVMSTSHGDKIVMRQEVPFERWFLDFGLTEPIKETNIELKARVYAFLSVLEGLVRTLAEAVCTFYTSLVSKDDAEALKHKTVLAAQIQGLQYSLMAVLGPNAVKEKLKNAPADQPPPIGCKLNQCQWGTIYEGKLTISLIALECSQYPWQSTQ